jgi:hypothetical protein
LSLLKVPDDSPFALEFEKFNEAISIFKLARAEFKPISLRYHGVGTRPAGTERITPEQYNRFNFKYLRAVKKMRKAGKNFTDVTGIDNRLGRDLSWAQV